MHDAAAELRDLERRTGTLEQQVAAHDEWHEAMERWQKQQNGSLSHLAERIDKVHARIDQIRDFLLVVIGGLVVQLILQILSMKGRP